MYNWEEVVNYKKVVKFIYQVVPSFFALSLVACLPQDTALKLTNEKKTPKTIEQGLLGKVNAEQKQEVMRGLAALKARDYDQALKIFNTALNQEPTNSTLHTLSGLAYQMKAKNGDFTNYELAEAGYQQAKKYDTNNIFAALQLGRVKIEKKDYLNAQEEFAEVLLYDPSNKDALYELMSASYLMGDMRTARMSIDQLLKMNSSNPDYLRAGALIYAVQGDKQKASKLLAQYKEKENNPKKQKYVNQRVNDWFHLHETGNIVLTSAADTYPQPPVVTNESGNPAVSPSDVASAAAAAVAAVASTQPGGPPPSVAPLPPAPSPEVIIVDAVVLRVLEEAQTFKGNNILDNFTLTLSPYNAYSANHAGSQIMGANIFPLNNVSTSSSTGTFLPGNVNSVFPDLSHHVSLITSGISFGTLNYALNIANATRQHLEIIGRPTLTSMLGKPAEFFNGSELDIALQGNFGVGTVTKTPTGSTLRVTPLSLEDGYITMDVEIIDSFLEETEASISAKAAALTPLVFSLDLSNVKTTVRVKMGDTIALAGTVERSEINSNSGFPLLKDIPVVQYFFSEEITLSEHQSVLYLITPRGRKEVRKAATEFFENMGNEEARPNLKELEKRHRNWLSPEKNIVPILSSLRPLYHDYRTGDVSPLQWGSPADFDEIWTEDLNFLYY